MKILIIEDNKNLISFLISNLKEEGFLIEESESENEGINMAVNNNYNIVIIDLNIPEKNREKICKEIRFKKLTPILILASELDIENKIKLLEFGADDYLVKPFSLKELVAKIKVLSRRQNKIIENLLQIKNIIIDRNEKKVIINKKEILFTHKEFDILELLASNKGRIISRKEILERIWDSNIDIFSNTIETHISNIRKKINMKLIKTISNRGYRID
ncbi:MAG: response regulator transcription factor [Candidatus Paceibacterota bacterium]